MVWLVVGDSTGEWESAQLNDWIARYIIGCTAW